MTATAATKHNVSRHHQTKENKRTSKQSKLRHRHNVPQQQTQTNKDEQHDSDNKTKPSTTQHDNTQHKKNDEIKTDIKTSNKNVSERRQH